MATSSGTAPYELRGEAEPVRLTLLAAFAQIALRFIYYTPREYAPRMLTVIESEAA